jgi:carboxypeptidase Q
MLRCAASFLLSLALFAQSDTPAKLIARAESESAMTDDLRELCDSIGGRPTGSRACERAVAWGAAKFRSAGLTRVAVEPYTIPRTWLPGTISAEAVAPAQFTIRAAAAPMSPSTGGVIEAPVIDVGEGAPEAFANAAARLKGAIVLVRSNEMKTLDDLFAEYFRNPGINDAAKRYGVAAVLLESSRPRGLLYRHPVSFSTELANVPMAVISREPAERLARLAERGEVRVRFSMTNKIDGPYRAANVVAEIPGAGKPDEIVAIGAHLDSWDMGTGAQDNGVNAATVIDIARAFQQLRLRPRRTVRFILFTGEEQGMLGSAAYVRKHQEEMNNHVAFIAFDTGSGRTSGFFLNGREELRKPVDAFLDAAGITGANDDSAEAIDGTDNFDFLISDVPNLLALQDAAPYLPDYHAESDTLERVNVKEARRNEAIAAAVMWGIADAPDRLAPRQSRAEIEKLLHDTKLDEQMKLFDQWDAFAAGRRGSPR